MREPRLASIMQTSHQGGGEKKKTRKLLPPTCPEKKDGRHISVWGHAVTGGKKTRFQAIESEGGGKSLGKMTSASCKGRKNGGLA